MREENISWLQPTLMIADQKIVRAEMTEEIEVAVKIIGLTTIMRDPMERVIEVIIRAIDHKTKAIVLITNLTSHIISQIEQNVLTDRITVLKEMVLTDHTTVRAETRMDLKEVIIVVIDHLIRVKEHLIKTVVTDRSIEIVNQIPSDAT